MASVHSLSFRPPPRHDGAPWTQVRIEESVDNVVFAPIDTQPLAPVDPDPTRPQLRWLTTNDATLAAGWYRAVAIDAAANESPPSASTYSPGADDDGYPTLEALLTGSSNVALADAEPAVQAALRRSAIAAVEAFTHQRFSAEGTLADPIMRRLDGSGTELQYLPKRLAVADSLMVNGSVVLAADYELSEDHDYLKLISPIGGSWVTRVRRHPDDPGPLFSADRNNVEVSGIWGWTADEWASGELDPVEQAIRYDMEDQIEADTGELAETVRNARALGLSSISQGGISLAFRGGGVGGGVVLSMRAQRKLVQFRWSAPVAAVV